MAVTTKKQFQTSDGTYYDDEKKATVVQSIIDKNNLIPFRTKTINDWVEQLYGDEKVSNEFKRLVENKSTDGSTIKNIVCDVIIKDLLHFNKVINSLHGESESL